MAYRVTANEARIDWLMENRPHVETWELLLVSRHFVPVLDPKELEAIAPFLPYLRSGRDPRVWITENHRVFVLFDPSGTRIYSLGKGLPERIEPELWEPLGHGWDAYESLSARTLPIPHKTVIPPRKGRKIHRDAREIDF